VKWNIIQQSSDKLFAWNAATCFRFISVTLSVTPQVRLIRSHVQSNGDWHVRLHVTWNKQGELISFDWNTICNSPSFNTRHTGCIFYCAHKRGRCHGMQAFCATKYVFQWHNKRKDLQRGDKHSHKISDVGGASLCKIRSTRGKLQYEISVVVHLTSQTAINVNNFGEKLWKTLKCFSMYPSPNTATHFWIIKALLKFRICLCLGKTWNFTWCQNSGTTKYFMFAWPCVINTII
jgi:hypothetical protein